MNSGDDKQLQLDFNTSSKGRKKSKAGQEPPPQSTNRPERPMDFSPPPEPHACPDTIRLNFG